MFIYQSGKQIIDPSLLNIGVFRVIYERDKSSDKREAFSILGWIYFMYHPKSFYREYKNAEKSYRIIVDTFPKKYQEWDPDTDELAQKAIEFYKQNLMKTPLWDATDALKEAMYNLSKIIRDPESTASDIRTASNELDALPDKYTRMRQKAEEEETVMKIEAKGDKEIKRLEQLPGNALR
jgi:DNA segregation ATPase FtsK/SpoIIIE-like protein